MSGGILQAAGPVAGRIADLGWLLLGGGALIFLFVMVLLALALRQRRGRMQPLVWVLGGGVLFPAVVLSALFFWALPLAPVARQAPPPGALHITVTGRMWWWELRYAAEGAHGEFLAANEVRIPVGRPVWLALAADDVIHSFWVPQLAGKIDMVPGRMQHLLLEADRPGIYRGQCAEFCGEQHARMALQVVALPPADFESWRQAQLLPAPQAVTPLQQRGQQVFLAKRCDACHTVRGITGDAQLGPDLTHVGSRLQIGAGTLANSPQALAQWIAHVQDIKHGARMPSYDRLDAASLDALAHWLGSLQ
ncbi:c-type cytochrome [uncultured Ramlibacter sp.]|uniref:cytochrome c oxidase subunit II n=1 Tax=uncultured Ramlibacter sp. TaxID=260755 RepID=UPI002615DA7F|nr:c-type cytochrome [uncultured Ramlibacter sp.]